MALAGRSNGRPSSTRASTMATRNVGATQNLNRHSMATGGTVVKNRQLVRRELGAPLPWPDHRPFAHPADRATTTDAPARAAGAAVGEPLGHGEPAAHDERAGRGDEGAGELARRAVSTSRRWVRRERAGADLDRFMAASKVLGEESVKEAGR